MMDCSPGIACLKMLAHYMYKTKFDITEYLEILRREIFFYLLFHRAQWDTVHDAALVSAQ